MASFAKARGQLLVVYDKGTKDDEKFVILWEQNVSKNPSFPYKDFKEILPSLHNRRHSKVEICPRNVLFAVISLQQSG